MSSLLVRRWAISIGLACSLVGSTKADERSNALELPGVAVVAEESQSAFLPVAALTAHQKETFKVGQQALARPVTIEFTGTSLKNALEDLQKAAGCKILLDEKTLSDNGIALDTPITLALEDVTLRTALEQITRPLDLGWTFRAPGFVVTTQDNVSSNPEFRIVVLYPVGDLVKTPDPGVDDYESLIQGIGASVDPDHGEGTITPVPSANALSIKQTWDVHEQIEAFLTALRQVKKQQSLPPGAHRPMGGGGGFF